MFGYLLVPFLIIVGLGSHKINCIAIGILTPPRQMQYSDANNTEVPVQFDDIDIDTDSGFRKFLKKRSKRSLDTYDPFSEKDVPTCSYSNLELDGLNNLVRQATDDITRIKDKSTESQSKYDCRNNNLQVKTRTDVSCVERLANFRDAVSCSVQAAMNVPQHIFESYDKTINYLTEKHEEMTKNYDTFIRQTDQDNQKKLEQMNLEYQKLQAELTNYENKVNSLRNTNLNTIASLVISHIKLGDLDLALEDYKTLGDSGSGKLESIIKKAYSKTISNFENTFAFSKSLAQLQLQDLVVAYKTLFSEMKNNEHLDSPMVLMLSTYVTEAIEMPNYLTLAQDKKNVLSTLQTEVQVHVERIISSWVENVRNSALTSIIEYTKKSELTSQNIDLYLPDLIKRSYGSDLKYFEPVSKLIKSLPGYSYRLHAYSLFLSEMRSSSHMDTPELIQLAYQVKAFMESYTGSNADTATKNKLEILKTSFPTPVRNLAWNSDPICKIKNTYNGEYLYTSKTHFSRSPHQVAFTSTSSKTARGNQGDWWFETYSYGMYFAIKNWDNQKCLSSNSAYSFFMGRTYAFVTQFRSDQWILEPINSDGSFRIKSNNSNAYIYAGENQSHYDFLFGAKVYDLRHVVFLGQPQGISDSKFRWKFECSKKNSRTYQNLWFG